MFMGVIDTFKKSQAAAVLEILLGHAASRNLVWREPAITANHSVGHAWERYYEAVSGRIRRRPNKMAFASLSAAAQIERCLREEFKTPVGENPFAFVDCIANAILVIETQRDEYALMDLDHEILSHSFSTATSFLRENFDVDAPNSADELTQQNYRCNMIAESRMNSRSGEFSRKDSERLFKSASVVRQREIIDAALSSVGLRAPEFQGDKEHPYSLYSADVVAALFPVVLNATETFRSAEEKYESKTTMLLALAVTDAISQKVDAKFEGASTAAAVKIFGQKEVDEFFDAARHYNNLGSSQKFRSVRENVSEWIEGPTEASLERLVIACDRVFGK